MPIAPQGRPSRRWPLPQPRAVPPAQWTPALAAPGSARRGGPGRPRATAPAPQRMPTPPAPSAPWLAAPAGPSAVCPWSCVVRPRLGLSACYYRYDRFAWSSWGAPATIPAKAGIHPPLPLYIRPLPFPFAWFDRLTTNGRGETTNGPYLPVRPEHVEGAPNGVDPCLRMVRHVASGPRPTLPATIPAKAGIHRWGAWETPPHSPLWVPASAGTTTPQASFLPPM